jgi:glycerophosphoryl diester phosphodiesterase
MEKKSLQRVAHRGGSHLAPENTLAAFRNALTLAVDAIELDVHMSRDGQLIVFHDNTVDRLTDGTGNILDLDFATLRSLNAAAHFVGGWPESQQIPTLREVLDLARGRVQVYIEIKTSKRDGVQRQYPGIVEAVVNDVRAMGMTHRVLVISFDWSLLPQVKALEPRIATGALVSQETWDATTAHALETLVQQAKALHVEWLNMDQKLFTDEMPGTLHAHNIKLGLWTVNTSNALRRFAHAGVDSLTTDRPDLFAELDEAL